MSTAELKQTVDSLSDAERIYLAGYLKAVQLAQSETHRAELNRRMKDMDAKRALGAAAVKELHQAMESKGL